MLMSKGKVFILGVAAGYSIHLIQNFIKRRQFEKAKEKLYKELDKVLDFDHIFDSFDDYNAEG